MKHKFTLISILTMVIMVVIAVLFYMNERSYHNSFNQKFGSQAPKHDLSVKKTQIDHTASLAPTAIAQVQATVLAGNANSNFKENWKQLSESLVKIAQRCEAAERELLPDNSLIDVNDPFYDNPDAVLSKYVNVLQEALFAEGAMHAAMIWEEALNGETNISLKEIMDVSRGLDICQGQRSLVFVETVFEAFSKKMWGPLKKEYLLKNSIGYLELRLLGNPPTIRNLSFAINLLLAMSAQALLPPETRAELDDLYDKFIEAEDQSFEILKMDRNENVKLELLRDSWRNNKYLAGEMIELLRRIGRISY